VLIRIVGITHGDTITLLDAKHHQRKIRLDGIDAPEGEKQFGQHQTSAVRNATR
jgi:micrococcal nuclease